MPEELNNAGPYRDVIFKLIRKSAKERAASQRWSITSVVLLIGIFAIIILLNFQPVNRWLTAGVALLGLVILWVFTLIRARRLEKKFYREELAECEKILPDGNLNESVGQEPASAEIPLTARELDILLQIAEGKTNKAIARDYNINESSVKNQVSRILRKLDVSNRTEAVLMALSRGWLKKEPDIR